MVFTGAAMANPDQLAKTLAQDIMDLDDLIDEARRTLATNQLELWWQEELTKLLREMPAQLYTVSISLLAYTEAVDNGYEVLKERMVL